MARTAWTVVIALHLAALAACGDRKDEDVESLAKMRDRLAPLHKRLGAPQPGDWLERFQEPGQTFEQFAASDRIGLTASRRFIYVVPLGDFTAGQRKVVGSTADFLGVFYCLPVKVQGPLPLSVIPKQARRVHPAWGMPQVLSTYVLDNVLRPRLPDDAAVYLAFTASDLWPGRGWNFVFGQASLRERVGVWSLYRKGDADAGEKELRLCLRRTLQTATHETGHMFGMAHCTAWECGMNGSNSLEESDRRPLAFCPECVAKLCLATGCDPAARFEALAARCEELGLEEDARLYRASAKAVRASPPPP